MSLLRLRVSRYLAGPEGSCLADDRVDVGLRTVCAVGLTVALGLAKVGTPSDASR